MICCRFTIALSAVTLLLGEAASVSGQTLVPPSPRRIAPRAPVEQTADETPASKETAPESSSEKPADVEDVPMLEPRTIDTPIYSEGLTYGAYPPCEDCWGSCWNIPYVPNMLGDFFGTGTDLLTVQGDELLNALPTDVLDPNTLGMGDETEFLLPSPGSSVLGRQKAAENNSPIPRDRVFFNYSYIANTSLQDGGVGVHRLTPGLERAFADDRFSWAVHVPVGVTFDSKSILTGGASRDQMEFGNLHFALKSLLLSRSDVAISAGLGATFPTADNLSFFNANGRELIRVENSAVHLLPYLAGAWSDGGWFVQSFLQFDFDLSGNPVLIDDGTGLENVGDFRDSDFVYWDIGAGYWLFKDRIGETITGFAPTLELHYNSALNTTAGVRSASGFQFGGNRGQVEVVNLLVGTTIQIHGENNLAMGWATPVGGGDDEQFDGEFRVLANWYFGGN